MIPFRVNVSQADLDELRLRLRRTRWPAAAPEAGWKRGVPVDYLRELTDYWLTGYDWRATEARLNSFDGFSTEIDGANIHFLHVRSPQPNAQPMILTHGWPGSVAEFLEVIGPLTDPAAHGADPADAFHLVIPSLPGFGFSGPVSEPGWGINRTAQAWAELMRRLGYDRYVAQGGDIGSAIAQRLGRLDAEHVAGVHVNMLITPPPPDPSAMADLAGPDRARLGRMLRFSSELSGYMNLYANRPQTLSYALNDSPVGQLAWIVEKFQDWTDPSATKPEDAVDRDLLLTNVMIYWLTSTAGSSAQFYHEEAALFRALFAGASAGGNGLANPPLPVPLGVAVFPHDIFLPVRRFAERDNPAIRHWTEFERGGHFAAMEQPDLLVGDVREFCRALGRVEVTG